MLIENSFKLLLPEKDLSKFTFKLKYHNKFKPYNANVKYRGNRLEFNLSKKWENVSEEIQIGLIQELLLKIFKIKGKTTNIDLYNLFMKNLHISAPKTNSDETLSQSFSRINEKYFFGMMDKTNLVWGNESLRKLGHYDFASDTILISSIFKNSEQELLDYIMYHEMLHKKLKFNYLGRRNVHHSREFRENEKKFSNHRLVEEKLAKLIRRIKLMNFF